MTTEWSHNSDATPLEAVSLTVVPCNPDVHGSFIRALTRENFYDIISRTIGWNDELYQQEPRFPERYTMVQRNGEMIGFFCIREEADYLYIHTIQLVPPHRGKGIGTALLQYIEGIARSQNLRSIYLRVFKENPAQLLYRKLGYTPIENDEYFIRMERVL
jgi:ribosomal protein S18 acetylase RimI-like enzyme